MAGVILGLDPGTNFGWAVLDAETGKRVKSGTWKCAPKKGEHRAQRWILFDAHIRPFVHELVEEYGSVLLAFEKVRRHPGTGAAHVYGGFVSILEVISYVFSLELKPIEVSTWKRVATGKGDATKDHYVRKMNKRYRRRMTVKKHEDEAAALGVATTAWEMRIT